MEHPNGDETSKTAPEKVAFFGTVGKSWDVGNLLQSRQKGRAFMIGDQKIIGVLTSGGDAPGMNAAIRAVTRTAIKKGIRVLGVRKGYKGLIHGDMVELNLRSVSTVLHKGGTMLYTARCPEFLTPEGREQARQMCEKYALDGLVVIGGDGSFRGARELSLLGVPCVGIPGTIDNDIACTDYTIGFDTALNTAVEAIDRLRDTSESHDRCTVVEVMGHGAGYLALYASIACGGTACWVNEVGFNIDRDIIAKMKSTLQTGKHNFIIIVSEGITDVHALAKEIQAKTGVESRATVLGHIQRGGTPTANDRIVASEMGYYAVNLLEQGIGNRVVIQKDSKIIDYDILEALTMHKGIDPFMKDVNDAINI